MYGTRAIKVLRDLPLPALRSNIATAEAEGVVDAEVIEEAKVLLATQTLRSATERRDVAGLRTAITVAESEAEADRATIEASRAQDKGQMFYTLCTTPYPPRIARSLLHNTCHLPPINHHLSSITHHPSPSPIPPPPATSHHTIHNRPYT